MKVSMCLIYNMVPPALERVLDMVLDGDKECVRVYVYARMCEL